MAHQLFSVCHILAKVASILGRSANYSRYSPEQKEKIGRYPASRNIASAARKYQAAFPNLRK